MDVRESPAPHPGSAERLHQYWVHGEGAARIRWGAPGDFDRCTRALIEEAHFTPGQAKGYCNLAHHVATGIWPAQHAEIVGHKRALPAWEESTVTVDTSRAALHVGMERRVFSVEFEIRARPDGTGGSKYNLAGYASVYNRPYRMVDKHGEYDETVRSGAGKKTLSENPDVVLVLNHEGMPMARTKNGSLHLSDDSTGLHFDAPQLNGERHIVREVVAAVDEGILDEASFAFKTTRQRWSDDYAKRDIDEYSLHRGDVSVVTFGANDGTAGRLGLRAQDFDALDDESARVVYERLARRFAPAPQTPPPGAMSLGLALALAQAQG